MHPEGQTYGIDVRIKPPMAPSTTSSIGLVNAPNGKAAVHNNLGHMESVHILAAHPMGVYKKEGTAVGRLDEGRHRRLYCSGTVTEEHKQIVAVLN